MQTIQTTYCHLANVNKKNSEIVEGRIISESVRSINVNDSLQDGALFRPSISERDGSLFVHQSMQVGAPQIRLRLVMDVNLPYTYTTRISIPHMKLILYKIEAYRF